MHLAESSFNPSLQNAQHTSSEKKKKNKEVSLNEISENFLNMLQKNMKWTQQNTLHETFQFLSHASNANNDSNVAFEATQDIYKPKLFAIDKDDYSRAAETTEPSAINNNHNSVQKKHFEIDEITEFSTINNNRNSVQENNFEIKGETKEKIQSTENLKNLMQAEKQEKNEEIFPKDEKPIEKLVNVKSDQAKSTQSFDELIPKMKKTSDAEVKKTEQNLGEVGVLSEKHGKDKIRDFRLDSRSSFVEKKLDREASQTKSFNTQMHNQPKSPDQNFRLGNTEKPIDQISGPKNQLGKNSLNVRGEYNFLETTNTQTQVRNSRFSKLLQNPSFKGQLNEQFQSMLHRARILIKDQKNVFLSTNLHPKELGTVSLKLSMMDGHLNGLFTVENETVQTLIAEKIDKILSELRKDGYQVTSFDVDVRSNNSSRQKNNMHNQNAPKQNSFFTESEETAASSLQDDLTTKTGGDLYA